MGASTLLGIYDEEYDTILRLIWRLRIGTI